MYVQTDTPEHVSIDDDIEKITNALSTASQAGEWATVRALTETLNGMLKEKRKRSFTAEHKTNLGHSNAIGYAQAAAENSDPNASLLLALAQDVRFGSLRRYAGMRGIPYSTLAAYASGRLPCSLKVDALIRRDFPKLKWTWPAGLATGRRGRPLGSKNKLDT